MSKELNCMNCSIGDFKHELCDCDNGFCKEFKSIGTQEDFFNAVMQRIRPQDEWIPVSERLPEELEEVLVCVTHNSKSKIAVSCRRDYNYWDSWGRDIIGEMAWMPLPEPYKGGDTE